MTSFYCMFNVSLLSDKISNLIYISKKIETGHSSLKSILRDKIGVLISQHIIIFVFE